MADCVALARDVAAEVAERSRCRSTSTRRRRPTRRAGTSKTSGEANSKGWPKRWRRRDGRPTAGPPRRIPRAGATVIGARMPLIAYNINLATDRLDVAKKIAAAMRHSSGGFRYVKAMGVTLEDRRHRRRSR